MDDEKIFEGVVATNGLQQPYRRRSQNNLKQLFALIVLTIGLITVGSTLVQFDNKNLSENLRFILSKT